MDALALPDLVYDLVCRHLTVAETGRCLVAGGTAFSRAACYSSLSVVEVARADDVALARVLACPAAAHPALLRALAVRGYRASPARSVGKGGLNRLVPDLARRGCAHLHTLVLNDCADLFFGGAHAAPSMTPPPPGSSECGVVTNCARLGGMCSLALVNLDLSGSGDPAAAGAPQAIDYYYGNPGTFVRCVTSLCAASKHLRRLWLRDCPAVYPATVRAVLENCPLRGLELLDLGVTRPPPPLGPGLYPSASRFPAHDSASVSTLLGTHPGPLRYPHGPAEGDSELGHLARAASLPTAYQSGGELLSAGLVELSLRGAAGLGGDGLASLALLPSLKRLDLSGCGRAVTDDSLHTLWSPSSRGAMLALLGGGVGFGGGGGGGVGFGGGDGGVAGGSTGAGCLSRLTHLGLGGCSRVGVRGVQAIVSAGASGGWRLASLSLHGCGRVDDAALKPLRLLLSPPPSPSPSSSPLLPPPPPTPLGPPGAAEGKSPPPQIRGLTALNLSLTAVTARGLRALLGGIEPAAAPEFGGPPAVQQLKTAPPLALRRLNVRGCAHVDAHALPGLQVALAASAAASTASLAANAPGATCGARGAAAVVLLGGERPTPQHAPRPPGPQQATPQQLEARVEALAVDEADAQDRDDGASDRASRFEGVDWATVPRCGGAGELAAWPGLAGLSADAAAAVVASLFPLTPVRLASTWAQSLDAGGGGGGGGLFGGAPTVELAVDEEARVLPVRRGVSHAAAQARAPQRAPAPGGGVGAAAEAMSATRPCEDFLRGPQTPVDHGIAT